MIIDLMTQKLLKYKIKINNMRPFIIDDTTKLAIERIKAYAEKNIVQMGDLVAIKHGNEEKIPGNNPKHVCNLPFGYRVVYSIEKQTQGEVRHLSISVDAKDKLPHQNVVETIMEMIGFQEKFSILLKQGFIQIESGDFGHAINVWEIIN